MSAKGSIGVALIGYGYWGPRWLRALSTLSDVRIEAVCTTSEGAVSEYPRVSVFRRYQEAIQSNSVQAVIIATPPSTHFDIAQFALSRGKHVLVEKPMTTKAAYAEKLITLARQHRLSLVVDHTYVYAPPIQKVQALIAQGRLGDVYCIESTRTNLGRFSLDGNVLWDLAPHDVSICNFLLQQTPTRVAVFGSAHVIPRIVDKADMHLLYPNNIDVYIHLSWLSPVKVRRLVVIGTEKMLVYDEGEANHELRIYNCGVKFLGNNGTRSEQFRYKTKGISTIRVSGEEPLIRVAKDFISSIKTGRPPLASGTDGKRVVEILEAANYSCQRGGIPVEVTYDLSR